MRRRFPVGGRDRPESEIVLSKVKAEVFLRDLGVQIMALRLDTRVDPSDKPARHRRMQTAIHRERYMYNANRLTLAIYCAAYRKLGYEAMVSLCWVFD